MEFTSRALRSACFAGLALAGLSAPALAEDRELSWSMNIGAYSDYIFRGFTQSDHKPEVQGGLDIAYGILYAGVWASGVDEGFVATDKEIDVYAGITPSWGKLTFDFGVLGYLYPNQIDAISGGLEVSYLELKAGAKLAATDELTLGAVYYYSPDYSFETGNAHAVEGSAAYALPQCGVFSPVINGVVGWQQVEEADFEGDDSYVYWNVGLAVTVEKLTFDFRYWDTELDNTALADERFVFGAKIVLP
jgi:uncharacterized protein (TIGR02001 family)